MALAPSKKPRSASVKQGSIDHMSSFLNSLPEKPKEFLSLREAVDLLREQIQSALRKGYSYKELADMLTDKGIKISALTLKNYVPSNRRAAKGQSTAKPRSWRSKKASVEESPVTTTQTQSKTKSEAIEMPPESKELNGKAEKPTPTRKTTRTTTAGKTTAQEKRKAAPRSRSPQRRK